MADGLILLAVDNKANSELLTSMLKRQYKVKGLVTETDLNAPFDLGIFDGVSLSRLRSQVIARQQSEAGVFLPILLVTTRQDINFVTRQLWKTIDEIIFTPIEKIELVARIEVLLRARTASLELNRLYQSAGEQATYAERQRMGRELHDTVSQMIFSASVLAQTLPRLEAVNPEEAKRQLEEVVQLNRSALSEMRSLLLDTRPDSIVRMGLGELFAQLAIAARGRRMITIITEVEIPSALPETIHLGLYRIVQEAFNNIVKHSAATEASVNLTVEGGQLVLRIRDNGLGFDTDTQPTGLGLEGMRERAALMDATFTVSSEKGRGTEIVVTQSVPKKLAIDTVDNHNSQK